MTIKEFVRKYFDYFGVNYQAIMRLIKKDTLKRGVHYNKVKRSERARYTVNEDELVKFFNDGYELRRELKYSEK